MITAKSDFFQKETNEIVQALHVDQSPFPEYLDYVL